MSYEFFITRADEWPETKHWSECQYKAISIEEWTDLIEADPELGIVYSDRLTVDELTRLVDETPGLAGTSTESGFIFSKGQAELLERLAEDLKQDDAPHPDDFPGDTADWKKHPKGERRCLWHWPSRGHISTKNPDMATIDKMLQMAEKLNACVRGDDGEIYRRGDRRFECYEPERGWLSLEEFHRGRPDWAPVIIREIAQSLVKGGELSE
jgi:hypothetical protein